MKDYYCNFALPCPHKGRRQWQPTPVLLPGKSHGRRAWWAAVHGVARSRTRLHFHLHFSLSCIGEGNGNPLQCSCLENPRDEGAWWAAVYGVTQSQTQLKRLSSSSSSSSQGIKQVRNFIHTQELRVELCSFNIDGRRALTQINDVTSDLGKREFLNSFIPSIICIELYLPLTGKVLPSILYG